MDRMLSFNSSGKTFALRSIKEETKGWYIFTERSRRFSSKIKIDDNNLRWVCEALIEASLQTGNNCKRWGRKVQTYTFQVVQNFNSYGRFVRIEAIIGANRSAIIIAEGNYNKGWGDIAGMIQGYLGTYVDPRFYLYADQSRSYKEAANISHWSTTNNTNVGHGALHEELRNENFLSKCLIGQFNDPFSLSPKAEVIQKWFTSRWQITAGLKVTPIEHNQFLFEFPSRFEANRVKPGDWFRNGRRLTLKWWSPVAGADMKSAKSEHRWVKAFGIPIHTWTTDTFKFIGDKCGGFVNIDDDTKHRVHFFWARICVVNRREELPRNLELITKDWGFEILLLEDAHTKIRPAEKYFSGEAREKMAGVGTSNPASDTVSHVEGQVGRNIASGTVSHIEGHVESLYLNGGSSGKPVGKRATSYIGL